MKCLKLICDIFVFAFLGAFLPETGQKVITTFDVNQIMIMLEFWLIQFTKLSFPAWDSLYALNQKLIPIHLKMMPPRIPLKQTQLTLQHLSFLSEQKHFLLHLAFLLLKILPDDGEFFIMQLLYLPK